MSLILWKRAYILLAILSIDNERFAIEFWIEKKKRCSHNQKTRNQPERKHYDKKASLVGSFCSYYFHKVEVSRSSRGHRERGRDITLELIIIKQKEL